MSGFKNPDSDPDLDPFGLSQIRVNYPTRLFLLLLRARLSFKTSICVDVCIGRGWLVNKIFLVLWTLLEVIKSCKDS